MTKPKLLLITAISPFPKDSGGAVRIHNTIKNLSAYYDLNLIFFKKPDYDLSSDDKNFLNKHCRLIIPYEINKKTSKYSFIRHFQPFWYSQFYNQNLIDTLPKIISKNKIDIVQIEFTQLLYLIKYIPRNIKTIFTAHDISTLSIKRRLQTLPKLKTKIAFSFRLFEVFLYESILLRRFNLVCSVSQHDQNILKNKFKLKNVLNVPNGIEKINFIEKQSRPKYICLGYIGSFSHTPNESAFLYFLNNIAPLLEKHNISYKFYLAGSNNPQTIQSMIKSSPIKNISAIVNLGFITSIQDFYKRIDILVAPIQSGSGTRIKILESLSFGIPVIASTIGAEGLNFKSPYLQIANLPQEYLKLIQNNPTEKQNNNSKNQLKKLLIPYLWQNIFKRYAQHVLK